MLIRFGNRAFYFCNEYKLNRFAYIGKGVKIFPRAKFLRPEQVSIGDYSSIGDFAFIETPLKLGRFCEFLTYATTTGREAVEIGDFVAISHGTIMFTSADDYTGKFMAPAVLPGEYRQVSSKKITVGDHAIICAHCLVFPGVHIGEGAIVGAGSIVRHDVAPWTINYGAPCEPVRTREREHILVYAGIISKRFGVEWRP